MSIYDPNLYAQSASFTFDVMSGSGMQDPSILKHALARYRPSLPSILDVLMSGYTPTQLTLGNYYVTPAIANMVWQSKIQHLSGTDISENIPAGSYELPDGSVFVTMFEDETPETQFFLTSTTAASFSGGTITISISATNVNGFAPIKRFQLDQVLLNFSLSTSVYARVTTISETNNTIGVVAYAGSAFTQAADFVTSGTSERLGIVDTASDFLRSLKPSEMYAPGFKGGATPKRYYLSMKQTPIEYLQYGDVSRVDYAGDRPKEAAIRDMAFLQHYNSLAQSFIWGVQSTISTTTADRQSYAGLYNSISTNSSTLSNGVLSLSTLETMIGDTLSGTYSSSDLYGFCSTKTLQLIRKLFQSLAGGGGTSIIDYKNGQTGLSVSQITVADKTVHLMPVREFSDVGSRAAFSIASGETHLTANANISSNLLIVDPAAVFTFVGRHPKQGRQLFSVEKNVAAPEEKYTLERDMIRSHIGFGLRHEKTSGKILNIRDIDQHG